MVKRYVVSSEDARRILDRPGPSFGELFVRAYDEIFGPGAWVADRVAAALIDHDRPSPPVLKAGSRGPNQRPETTAAVEIALVCRRRLGDTQEDAPMRALAPFDGPDAPSLERVFDLLRSAESGK
jgi:hypothetical protein